MIFPSILVIILLQGFGLEAQSIVGDVISDVIPTLADLVNTPVNLTCRNAKYIPLFTKYEDKLVEFFLWTQSNAEDEKKYILQPFSLESLQSSPFDGNKMTYVLLHGYTDNGTKPWILEAKTEILKLEDANIFSLNFSALVAQKTSELDYVSAVCNAYKIANYSAHVFQWIGKNTGLNVSKIHLIGHSLGGQIAGVMGKYMIEIKFGKVNRITGLDPAGVLFTPTLINNIRLDQDKGNFVDIIHTNGCFDITSVFCSGIHETIGHADFFPNGGRKQPGCDPINGSCSHQRVTAYFVESIKPLAKNFISWPCESYDKFTKGECPTCGSTGCANMGFRVATDARGEFYLTTNAESPFAKGEVQL